MSYQDWHRETRAPSVPVPAGACDCSIHVFGPPDVGQLVANRRYDPLPATVADLERVHDILGIERAVLVQASIYGTDHTVLLGALRSNPGRYRGIAAVDDSVSDGQLAELHGAGARGARFNMLSRSGARFDGTALERLAARCERLGWNLSLHGAQEDFVAHREALRRLSLPVIIDNFAYFDPQAPHAADAMAFFEERLATGHWWLKVARYDLGKLPPYDDTLAPVARVVAAAPQRILWGSDWPHVLYAPGSSVMPEDGALLELLARQVPDAGLRAGILRDNPAALFGFPT